MGNKLTRAKAIATGTSTAGPPVATARQRRTGGSRRTVPSSVRDPDMLSFSLGDLRDMRLGVVAKGVVVKPPRPHLILEIRVEVPIDTPPC